MKKFFALLSIFSILLLAGCGKNTSTTTTSTSGDNVITVSVNHTYEDPYVVDISTFKNLLTTYSDENGELLYNMLTEWDGPHNNWAELRRDEDYDNNPDLYLSDGEYKYEPCYLIGLDIFYLRTGEILTNPMSTPINNTTVIEIKEDPLVNPETDEEMSISETFDYLYNKANEGDSDASEKLIAYLNPTSEFINSLTIPEFKEYFYAYMGFFSNEEIVFNEEPTNEVWEQIKKEFINGLNAIQ